MLIVPVLLNFRYNEGKDDRTFYYLHSAGFKHLLNEDKASGGCHRF